MIALADLETTVVPVLEGDERLTNARPPTAHAHDYAATAHTHDAAYAAANHAHAAAAPAAHKASHATGGSDALTAADVGAAASGHNHDGTYSAANHVHALPANDHARQHGIASAADHTFPGGTTTYLRADGTFATPASGGGQSKTVLGAPVTNNNAVANTMADVTGLSFPVVAATRYRFKFVIPYTAAATTTGSRWGINGPATSLLHYRSEYSLTATSRTFNEGLAAYNLPAASNATSAATGSNLAVIEGIVTPSANGTVIARFASEVASSAIVALSGAYVEFESY